MGNQTKTITSNGLSELIVGTLLTDELKTIEIYFKYNSVLLPVIIQAFTHQSGH
jgi:hypothetical protein